MVDTTVVGDRDRAACQLAQEYLLSFPSVTEELLRRYLEPSRAELRPATLNGVFEGLLASAQNANMKAGVVGKSIGGVSNLGRVLSGFDPRVVNDMYTKSWERLLDTIEGELRPRGKIRRTPRSIWPLFCRTVLSGASFLAQFTDGEDFFRWVDAFDQDDRTRPALPLLLTHEIDGLGFPLACDFLKELGYLNYAKPDIHVKTILRGIGLAPAQAGDYPVFKVVLRIARHRGVTPYHADKLFWLVGSGNFYKDAWVGSRGKIDTDRTEFIRMADRKLKERFGAA